MPNQHIAELHRMMVNRYAVDSAGMTNSEWLCKNTFLKGRPFSFNRYPFQRELVDDTHRNLTVVKPSQVGVSEIFQRAALAFLTRNRNSKGIYAYPDDEMRKKNVQTRVMPLVENTKVFNLESGASTPVRSIQLLQIATSFLYMTGSKVGDATSTDADFVFLDEYDLHDMAIASLFSSRLQNSDFKLKKKFSTPTYSEFGVDQDFKNSDQMYYMIKCSSCNKWQFPMFEPKFIVIPNLPSDINDLLEIDQGMIDTHRLDLENAHVCCERCRAPLDLGREDNRSWVAKYPSRTHSRGRKVNPFSVSTRPVGDIVQELLEYKRKDFIRGFKNSVLGEAEDSSSARISEVDIRACLRGSKIPDIRKDLPAWVGIDMGHTVHLVLGLGYTLDNIQVVQMLSFPIEKLYSVLAELDKLYTIVGGLVDRHPESLAASACRDLTNGRVLPCEYRGSKELNLIETPDKLSISHAQADRTTLLDEVASSVRLGRITFAGYGIHESDVVVHLRNMVRQESPETPATWAKLDPQDHFFHAVGFMLSAVKLKKLMQTTVESPQTFIGVAGASNAGYNSDLLGNKPKANSAWQTSFLR